MIKNFVKILELLGDRLEVCVSVHSKPNGNKKKRNSEQKIFSIHMGLEVTKPVFGVSDKARLKPVSPATETS